MRTRPSILRSRVARDPAANRRAAVLLAAVPSVATGIVVLAVVSVFGPIGAAVAAGAAVACALGATFWTAGGALATALVGAEPAGDAAQPRLHNLLEGLCAAAGLPKPAVLVVDDPSLNSMSVGRNARRARLVVTRGLVDGLTRVELEGVLAHELAHVKASDTAVSTVAVAVVGPVATVAPGAVRLLAKAAGPSREQAADLAAVSLTRYPPGLLDALEKMRGGDGPHLSIAAARCTAHLWSVPERSRALRAAGAPSALDHRVQALREL